MYVFYVISVSDFREVIIGSAVVLILLAITNITMITLMARDANSYLPFNKTQCFKVRFGTFFLLPKFA